MNAAETQKTADFLKALGEFNRLSLVYELCRCEASQNAMCLCDCCSVDASVVSRHLKLLAERDIVTFDKVGREKTYRLNRNEVATQLRELADLIENKDCVLICKNSLGHTQFFDVHHYKFSLFQVRLLCHQYLQLLFQGSLLFL